MARPYSLRLHFRRRDTMVTKLRGKSVDYAVNGTGYGGTLIEVGRLGY